MNNRQLRQYDMLVRVRDFGAAHGEWFPESSIAAQALDKVGGAVAQLTTHAVEQLALKREGTRARAAARQALVDIMESISRTARIIQEEEPGFPNAFLMPERQSAQALLTSARLFTRELEPVAARLIAHSLPATLAADLAQALGDYERAVRGRESGKGQSAAARARIEGALDQGLAAARKLDVIVANHVREDPVALAEWERDRQIGPRARVVATVRPPEAPGLPPVAAPEAA